MVNIYLSEYDGKDSYVDGDHSARSTFYFTAYDLDSVKGGQVIRKGDGLLAQAERYGAALNNLQRKDFPNCGLVAR